MDVGIVGGGINGLCTAWRLAAHGHRVTVYERDMIMCATSRASSKLLHGGLRYLEHGKLRLVKEALAERNAWLKRAPHLAKPLRFLFPLYRQSRRSQWMVAAGLFLYGQLGGNSNVPRARRACAAEVLEDNPELSGEGLVGGLEFTDGQMDDYELGLWVADQARACGVEILEHFEVSRLTAQAGVIAGNKTIQHERLLNIAGPWAVDLLKRSGLRCPYNLDLVRGSHLVLNLALQRAYLLEVPDEKRIFFAQPWKGKTLVGTTEVRQALDEPIVCSSDEQSYLLRAFSHYFPQSRLEILEAFAGVRPLVARGADASKVSREYVIHREERLITVLGGKWTTATSLARLMTERVH